jgi:hypothetical protein
MRIGALRKRYLYYQRPPCYASIQLRDFGKAMLATRPDVGAATDSAGWFTTTRWSAEIAQTVATPGEVDAEIRALLAAVAGCAVKFNAK